MRRNLGTIFLAVVLAFTGCSADRDNPDVTMTGVWTLRKVIFPTGYTLTYPNAQGYTRCKIYDSDSTFYHAELLSVGSETMVIPLEMERYTLIHDSSDTLLVENGRFMMHFRLTDDTTYTVYNNLEQELWTRTDNMSEKRRQEICDIVRNNIGSCVDDAKNFIFSTSEKRLQEENRKMLYITVILALVAILLITNTRHIVKKNRAMRRELELINEQNRLRPQPVTQAIKMVEQEFFSSPYYRTLRSRIENGETLKESDWEELEEKIKPVYPHFTSRLHNLHNMSLHEFQVCLLLKINIPPSQIASVLCKEVSSISSTRSRLYCKVFGKKGSSKEWDAFIATL